MKKITDTVERVRYIDKCPICKKEIKGFSESQVKYNLGVHVKQKHPDKLIKDKKK